MIVHGTDQFACARLANGELWGWGRAERGRLGDGHAEDAPTPRKAGATTASASSATAAWSRATIRCGSSSPVRDPRPVRRRYLAAFLAPAPPRPAFLAGLRSSS